MDSGSGSSPRSDGKSSESQSSPSQEESFSSFVSATEFKNLGVLGKGGFGKVFKVLNLTDGKEYAIKVVKFNNLKRDSILREVKALAQLDHPNVIRYYGAWVEEDAVLEDSPDSEYGLEGPGSEHGSQGASVVEPNDTILYIQMELYPGNLQDEMDGKISLKEAWRFLFELVSVVDYIHSKKIIHRDLSTMNVFLDSDKRVKLGDFGLARFFHADDPTVMIDGSPYIGNFIYRAPEMKVKNPKINKLVDVFSLGIIMFELLHGPFDTGFERISVLGEVGKGKLPASWDDNDHSAYILKMVDSDPAKRPSTAEILGWPLPWPGTDLASTLEGVHLADEVSAFKSGKSTFNEDL